MKKTEQNLQILTGFFIASLILANILASKIVMIGSIVIPAAVVAYPLTFLITDIVGEIWGKKESNHLVKIGLICQIFSLLLIFGAILLPVAPFLDNQQAFSEILGSSARVIFASLVAYLIAQSLDVHIFHKLKEKMQGEKKWIRNNASTMISQFLDTSIFITIAFIGVVPNIWVMIVSQYLIKLLIAVIDTPFFYFFTKNSTKIKNK